MRKHTLWLLGLCLWLCACGIDIPAEKQNYIGQWQGENMELWIGANGTIDYESWKGAVNTEIEAPIQRFDGNNFDVGVWFFSTTFTVQKPPYQENGVWKMMVEGQELTRIR